MNSYINYNRVEFDVKQLPIVNKLKKFIKNHINKAPRNHHLLLLDNREKILLGGKIYLNILEYNGRFDQLLKYNSKKIIEEEASTHIKNQYNISKIFMYDNELTKKIIEYLNKYNIQLMEGLTTSSVDMRTSKKYINCLDFDKIFHKNNINLLQEDEDIAIPDDDFDRYSLLTNLYTNADLLFAYNHNLSPSTVSQTSNDSKIHKFKLQIAGGGGDVIDYPVKYKAMCKHKDEKTNVECGNVVYFNEQHLVSKIYCTDSLNITNIKKRHLITPSKAILVDSRKVYIYEGKDLDNNNNDNQIIIYSLIRLEDSIVDVNGFFSMEGDKIKYRVLWVVSVKDTKQVNDNIKILQHKPSEDKILINEARTNIPNPLNKFWLEDIYTSLKQYYHKYHNINVDDRNKIVAQIIIFQLLTKNYFNKFFHSIILGKSGSGKSFWIKNLLPMFTINYSILTKNATKNALLGGKSSFEGVKFSPGRMATRDCVVIEEATEGMNEVVDVNNKFKSDRNIFQMLKEIDINGEEPYEIGVYGGNMKIMPRACLILTGNLENLEYNNKKYKKLLRTKYKNYTNGEKVYSNKWPLFRPIKFYYEKINDEELAKAHEYIRRNEYITYHYITHLPEAEQSRFAFFVVIEDSYNEGTISRGRRTATRMKNKIHTKEFRSELDKIFKNKDDIFDSTQKDIVKLREDIEDYFKDEYINTPTNISPTGKGDRIWNHLYDKQLEVVEYLIYLNKLYWNEELKFTQQDKDIINWWMRFNYNVISSREAMMNRYVEYNSYIFKEDDITQFDDKKKDEFRAKLLMEAEDKKKANEELSIELDENEEVKITTTKTTTKSNENDNPFDSVDMEDFE